MYRLLLLLVCVCDSETADHGQLPPTYTPLTETHSRLSPSYSSTHTHVTWNDERVEFKRATHTISTFEPDDESYKQPYHWLTFPVQLVLGNTVGKLGKQNPEWGVESSKVYLKSIEFYCFLPIKKE